jgi:Fe2+ transport system protein B
LKSEIYYIQAQLNVLGIHLALGIGEFETRYKNASGTEITVKRSADGKFASKNSNDSQTADIGSVERLLKKQILNIADNLKNLSTNTQNVAHKLIFESVLAKNINTETNKVIKEIKHPTLTAGFELGQNIRDKFAKIPFDQFEETITNKITEYKKQIPQKTKEFKKEIVRIANDPNTSATIAAGMLLGLGAYFHITAAQKFLTIAKNLAGLTNPEIQIAIADYKLTTPLAQKIKDGLVGGSSGLFRFVVGNTLISNAGRVILERIKANSESALKELNTKDISLEEKQELASYKEKEAKVIKQLTKQ